MKRDSTREKALTLILNQDWVSSQSEAEQLWAEMSNVMGDEFSYTVLRHLPATTEANILIGEGIAFAIDSYRKLRPKRSQDFALGLRLLLLSRRDPAIDKI